MKKKIPTILVKGKNAEIIRKMVADKAAKVEAITTSPIVDTSKMKQLG